MTSKERILAVVEHKTPDRIPAIVNLSPPVAQRVNKLLGNRYEKAPFPSLNTMIAGRASYNELLVALGNDCIGIAPSALSDKTRCTEDGMFFDEWSMGFRTINGYQEVAYRPLENAENVEDIDAYPMPDPTIPERWTEAKRLVDCYGDEYAVMGCLGQTLFETSWNLIGFEKFLMDFCMEEAYILRLFDRLTEYALRYIDCLLALRCDIIFLGDDVGTQLGMLISAESWRKHLKPRMAKICSYIKEHSSAKIAYHSCGSITPIISDLAEIGIDILNPIQPLAEGMDLAELKDKHGNELCFYGAVDVQRCIPFGTEEEVVQQVKSVLEVGTPNGGMIIAPAHIVPSETSAENVMAFFRAVKEYGAYSI